jgi:hypothetical protein
VHDTEGIGMEVTLQERMSMAFWWLIALGVTTYLILGIINTAIVITQ